MKEYINTYNDKTIDILGAKYKLYFKKVKEDKTLKGLNGYCDYEMKIIVVSKKLTEKHFTLAKKTIVHEIIHAFIYESGIINYPDIVSWTRSEQCVDFFAMHYTKMFNLYKELDLI